MTGTRRRFGDLLREALDDQDGPVTFAPGEAEGGLAELTARLAAVRRGIAGGADRPRAGDAVTAADIAAFSAGTGALTHAQQRRLFADPALRDQVRALLRELAMPLPGGGVAEMPQQVAAAGAPTASFSRPFAGGTLRVEPVGIDDQVYVVLSFDDPTAAARVLVVERPRDARLARLDLPAPEDGEVVVVKDMALAADAELVGLLRDPGSSGVFLR